MKKFCVVLAMLLAFGGCVKEPENEIIQEEPESSIPEGFEDEENIESEIIIEKPETGEEPVSLLGTLDEIEIYSNAVETGNTRPDIFYGKDGVLNSVIEVPEIEYWITNSEGDLLIDHPFYNFEFSEEIIPDWDTDDFRYPRIQGSYKGDWYRYIFVDGSFKLTITEKAGEFELNYYKYPEQYENYNPILYNYGLYNPYFGISDKDGNVIVEPIFSYVLQIPFENRIVGTTNNNDRNDGVEGFSVLMDFDGNIICTYSNIYFHYFDDGSYIGIAWYGGYDGKYGHLLKDENGKILETGHRFIDKDGNVLSPCFDLHSLCGSVTDFIEEYLDKTAVFEDENGKEFEIIIKDYICRI